MQRSWSSRLAAAVFCACGALLFALVLRRADAGRVAPLLAEAPALWLVLLPVPISLIFDSLASASLLGRAGDSPGLLRVMRTRLAADAVAQSLPSGPLLGEAVAFQGLRSGSRIGGHALAAALLGRRLVMALTHLTWVLIGSLAGRDVLAAACPPALRGALSLLPLAALTAIAALLLAREALWRGSLASRLQSWLLRLLRRQSQSPHPSELDAGLRAVLAPPLRRLLPAYLLAALSQGIEIFETFLILELL